MTIKRKLPFYLLRFFVTLLLLVLLSMGAVYAYLQQDPQNLVNTWLEPISQKTGLKFEIGSIDVTLLPLPAIAVSDVRITGPKLDFHLAWGQARPSLLEILHGNIFPGTILLIRAKLFLSTDLPLSEPARWKAALNSYLGADDSSAAFSIPGNLRLEINQFDAVLTGLADSSLTVNNLNADVELWKDGDMAGNFRIPACRLWENRRTRMASLEQFQISGRTNLYNFTQDTLGLKTNGIIKIANILDTAQFGCEFDSYSSGWSGRGSIKGALTQSGSAIPFSLLGRLTRVLPGQIIAIRGLDWSLGNDSGSIDAELQLPDQLNELGIQGTFLANRISLTEWLGFARNLPPGLQLALDNITKAKLKFDLTPTHLKVTNISATCTGATFTGSGGVADFKKPVVALDLSAPRVNLGLGLPESVGVTPDAPYFPHPPLTPMPGEPLKPGETGIGYDIRLGATLVRYGPLNIKKAALRIYPGKLDKSGLEDVLLDAKADFYGGTISGTCILGADKSLPLHITAKARQVNGPALSKDMPILPLRQGKWDGNAVVTSRGKELTPFLANLKGDISATGYNATLAATGTKLIFSQLVASTKLRTSSWTNRIFTMDGEWKTRVNAKDWDASADIDGKISIGEAGLSFRQLPGVVTASLKAGPLPRDTKLKIQGKFSGQSAKTQFEMLTGTAEVPGLLLKGSCRYDGAKNTLQGQLATTIASLRHSASQLGFDLSKLPASFNRASLSADYLAQPGSVKLSHIQGTIGTTTLNGNIGFSQKSLRPVYEVAINMGDVALPVSSNDAANVTNWNFPFLKEFDAFGQIKILNLKLWNTGLSNFVMPFRLDSGVLRATPITTNFYGAPLKGSLSADFNKGLQFDTHIKVNAFNLANAAKDQKLNIKLQGMASIDLTANAKLTGRTDLITALNAQWAFTINNGSWQSIDNKGQTKGKPVSFKIASATGSLQNGSIKSQNFKLTGPTLNVTGGGWVNISKKDMDCNFYVSMKSLPDFPLRVYGSLGSPKTSIGAGKLILNAVGEVASGFVDAVGGVLKGAWNIFKR